MAIRVEDRARPHGGIVRTLTLARPERRNALDPEHFRLLEDALQTAAANASLRVLVITGEGSAFCSGYDLANPLTAAAGAPDAIVMRTMAAVRACPLPIVARVNGPAYGAGLELAISCDLRIASENASFCLPPARLGIAYAPEGLARLVSLIGTSAARRLVFTAEAVSARIAADLGLIDELVSPDVLDGRIAAVSDSIADNAPLALAAMKRTLNALEGVLSPAAREAAEQARLTCYGSQDAAEGVLAFAERRPPLFRGR